MAGVRLHLRGRPRPVDEAPHCAGSGAFLAAPAGCGQAHSLPVGRAGGMKLAGKRVLITGGSQGFGLAVARAFIEEGASVMLCARGAEELYHARERLAEVARQSAQVLAT